MTLYAWYYSNKNSTIYTRTSTPSIEDTLYDSTGATIARSILSVASDYSYIKDDRWNEQHLRDSSKDIIEAQYVSNLSDGTNTYVIKDAEARTGLASKQDTLVSGTNIKTVGGASLLGSGNIALPTKTSDLTNDSGFITTSALSGYQTTTNLVTSVSSSSTDSQYPSAKLFYDTVGDIESALNTINSGGGNNV